MPAIRRRAAAPPSSASGSPVNGSILRTSAAKPLCCSGAASGAARPEPACPFGVGRWTAGGAGRADSVVVDVAVGVGVPVEPDEEVGATGPTTWLGGGSGLWCGGVVVGVAVSRGVLDGLGVAFGVFVGVVDGVSDGVVLGVWDGTGLVVFTGGGSGFSVRVTVSVTVGVGDCSGDAVTVTDGVAIGAGPATGRCGWHTMHGGTTGIPMTGTGTATPAWPPPCDCDWL